MHPGRTVFAQLMDIIPAHDFRRCVDRYQGNRKVSSFSCWDQFLCMAFAQLTYRESLRDIETCLRALGSRLYHLGIRGQVARSTLADANETRDYRIYADLAQVLIATARRTCFSRDSSATNRFNQLFSFSSSFSREGHGPKGRVIKESPRP
jgi:hypothetical protein